MLPFLPNVFRLRDDGDSEIWGGKRRLFDIMENFAVQPVLPRGDRPRAGEVLLSTRKIHRKPPDKPRGKLRGVL